ncbi:large with signal peptide [Cryptosporidium sp. chipmunk genotype I]|uniref:large with signal peptide n=1 Tax=Cryptosporidium sp. chipmunk genotype I TaxID=1280935 RepID=UPI00351A7140|nr:large with signal peptide [Cryptosporidium sp. chipmunk genotype I]
MKIRFLILLFCCVFVSIYSAEEKKSDDTKTQWHFILTAIRSHPNIKCKNLPNEVPGAFYSHGETKFTSEKDEKIRIMKENCVGALSSLLEIHLPRSKRKYSFKFSDINRVDEIMKLFCSDAASQYFISGFTLPIKTESPMVTESTNWRTNQNLFNSSEDSFHDYEGKTDQISLIGRNALTLGKTTNEKKCAANQLDFSKTPSELTSERLGYSVSECEQFENEGTPISKYKTPKVLSTILKSVLDENREDLPALEITISQLPKQVQNRVLSFFRSKNIDGIVEILNKLPRKVVESFINSIELEKKQIKFQLGTSLEQLEFSIPLLEDEWRAIIDFMSDPSSPVQYEKKINPYKQIKIPKEFKYSNGILKKFIQYCRRGIRSLAYEKYISEDGVTYYSYNENNLNGILIAGNDSDHRKEQVETFCYMVFERLYGKKEKEMMNKRHMKALEIKKSWEDGGVKGAVIDQLLKSFSDEINDERLQWLFLVESASVPNPLVYSTDLPKHTIPISFTSKPTDATNEITGKIRSFVYNCRSALMTLGVEKFPGTKSPLNKVHLGVDKVQDLIKFCKSVAHRYMGRLVEWLNIIQASLDDDVIRLIDMKNPEFRCPDYFEYEDESKLADNCSKTILMMINENRKAEENRRAKVWKGLRINCQPNHVNQHIRSFCNSVANERPDIRIASINELSELGIGSELSSIEEVREGYSNEQAALEIVEERLKTIESKQTEEKSSSAYKLDKWNQLQEFMVENRRVREKLDKYSRRQFQKLFEIEDAQKDLLLSLLSEDIITEKKRENIRDLIDKYSSDLLSMRTEWADLLFQISNNNRKITEAEIEIMNFVHQALDYIAISHRIELVNSSTMANMVNWEDTLLEKERIYINSKMLEYSSRLDSDQNIQKLKDIHYKRRQLFEKNLFRTLPRKLWNRVNTLSGKGLHPLIPIKISEKELKERKSLIVKLHEEKNNMVSKYDSEGQKLARQLIVIEKVVDKHLADLNEMWDSAYSIEYSIQWELRIKDMQDTYLYLNNEYNRNAEFITRQQLRQSQLQIGNPQYQQLLSETNQSIEIATDEMKKLLKLMNELRQKRNELDTLVESDLSKNYAEKINTLRRNSKLLEDNISNDISILQKKNEISQLQLNRDIKYFEITNVRSAFSERLKKSEGLIEANIWLNTKNEQLFSGYESKLNDDLSSLTYSFEKSDKYETYFNMEEIPNEALSELNKYKEQLKISLFNVRFYNDKISDNDMQHIHQFESMDANTLAYKELFESEGEIDDGTLYGEISTLEWNIIQSRWELLKMKHFYIEKKEKILLECAEMRNSLDELMLQKYGMIPVTKPKSVPSKANILAMKGIGIDLGEELVASDEKNNLSYDGKVLKLVQKRLEDANSVFEQELSNRLSILDEKIREGRIRLHEAAREVVSNWELQQTTASFRFASPQNKDRMREAFVRERDKVTKEEIKKTIPLKLEKHILLQQQKDRALQFKRDIDWIHTPGRVASQLMKFEQKIRIFRKKRHDHYEKTLKFLTYQAEQVDRIKQIDEELNAEETNGSRSNGPAISTINNIQELKKERERLEVDLAQKRKEYQMQLSSFQNERDALYDVSKNLTDDENS